MKTSLTAEVKKERQNGGLGYQNIKITAKMTAVSTERAYSAFEKQLRTLCLREFPCGTGSWVY